jgi:hypothetical protein
MRHTIWFIKIFFSMNDSDGGDMSLPRYLKGRYPLWREWLLPGRLLEIESEGFQKYGIHFGKVYNFDNMLAGYYKRHVMKGEGGRYSRGVRPEFGGFPRARSELRLAPEFEAMFAERLREMEGIDITLDSAGVYDYGLSPDKKSEILEKMIDSWWLSFDFDVIKQS